MEKQLIAKTIKARSLFKYFFLGSFIVCFIYFLLIAIFSGSGYTQMVFNGERLIGIKAILASPCFALVSSIVFSLFFWLMLAVGIKVYTYSNLISVRYISVKKDL